MYSEEVPDAWRVWVYEGMRLGVPMKALLQAMSANRRLKARNTFLTDALCEEQAAHVKTKQEAQYFYNQWKALERQIGTKPKPRAATSRQTPEQILRLATNPPLEVAEAAYRALAKSCHPDAGGNQDQMRQLNWAIEQLRRRAG